MSDYKFLKAVISDEQLQDEIRRAKVDLNLNDEQLVKLALIEYLTDNKKELL